MKMLRMHLPDKYAHNCKVQHAYLSGRLLYYTRSIKTWQMTDLQSFLAIIELLLMHNVRKGKSMCARRRFSFLVGARIHFFTFHHLMM